LTLEMKQHKRKMKYRPSDVKDGRLFNALADLEAQDGRLGTARNTLLKGMKLFPRDQSLLQAAGRVEEKVGNFTGARDWYSASLSIEPSAPTLVAYAMLELRHPEGNLTNYTKVCRLFEEALLLDPRHGPVYNAYGNMELKRGNVEKSRNIYQNGVNAHCTDVASVYHGLAKVELATGNVEEAKSVLRQGLKQVEYDDGMMDSNQKKRALFLAHTLGFLELRTHRIAEAKNVFQSGIERNGPSSQLLLGAALCEVKLNRIDLARKLFEQAVNVDRGHAQAWQMWGVMEMRAGNYKVAKMLFECGLKNDPSHGALWQAYATLESRRGKTNVSRTLFAKGILKCPKHVPLYQAWACLEMRNENYDKAKVLISEALTRNKKAGSGWVVAAKIEENLGNRPLMALILRRGLEYDPYCYQLYIALADYEFQRGRVQAVCVINFNIC
jgi:tetratricopeptide (TPR) repeat protein